LTGGAIPLGSAINWSASLPAKAEGFYKTPICGVALHSSSLRRTQKVRLTPQNLRALHLSIFEQPERPESLRPYHVAYWALCELQLPNKRFETYAWIEDSR